MARHNQTGQTGEEMAGVYMAGLGFTLLHRNWRYKRNEIDLVASRAGKLHFIEVKTRTTATFGQPEESITRTKLKSIMKAAVQYMVQHPGFKYVQYDVLAITLLPGQPAEFFYIEDVYL